MKNSEVLIRAYDLADKPMLSAIWYDASQSVHAFLGEALLTEHRQLVEDVYLDQAETWVACLYEKPVGFIGLLDHFIGGLFIAPSAQGKGVGRQLVSFALARKGQLALEVYADNSSACRFYQQLGFREVGRRSQDDNGLPFAVIEMHLSA